MRQNASNRISRSPSLSFQHFTIFSSAKDFTSNSLPGALHSALQIYQTLFLLFIFNIRKSYHSIAVHTVRNEVKGEAKGHPKKNCVHSTPMGNEFCRCIPSAVTEI